MFYVIGTCAFVAISSLLVMAILYIIKDMVAHYYADKSTSLPELGDLANSYKSVFRAISDPSFIIEVHTRKIFDFNHAAARCFNIQKDDLKMYDITDFFVSKELFNAFIDAGASNTIMEARSIGGVVFNAELTTSFFLFKNTKYCVISIRDLSAKSQVNTGRSLRC